MAVGGQGSHRHVTGLLGSSHLLKVCGFPHPTPSPPRVLGSSSSTSTTGTPGKSPSWPLLQWVSHTYHSDLESRPTLVLPGCSWPAQGRTFLTGTVSSGWHQEVLSPEPTQQWGAARSMPCSNVTATQLGGEMLKWGEQAGKQPSVPQPEKNCSRV